MESTRTVKDEGRVPRERAMVPLALTVSPFGPGGKLKLGEPDGAPGPLSQAVKGGADVGKTVSEPARTDAVGPAVAPGTVAPSKAMEMFLVVREEYLKKIGNNAEPQEERQRLIRIFIKSKDVESMKLVLGVLYEYSADESEATFRIARAEEVITSMRGQIADQMKVYEILDSTTLANGSGQIRESYECVQIMLDILSDQTIPKEFAFSKLTDLKQTAIARADGRVRARIDDQIAKILEDAFE